MPSRTRGIKSQPIKSIKIQSPVEKTSKFSEKNKSSSSSIEQDEPCGPVSKRKTVECVRPRLYNPVRQDLYVKPQILLVLTCEIINMTLKISYKLFKILLSDFTSIGLVNSTFGKVYKGSIVANQNQLTDNTDLIPTKQVLECPPFDLPELTFEFMNFA